MSVYMHKAPTKGRYGPAYHLMADSHQELIECADEIGLSLVWIQREGTEYEHFDLMGQYISKGLAIAQLIDDRTAVELIRRKRSGIRSYNEQISQSLLL